ncbi:hypothetical protein J6590_029925 [Homalodisca vitripennis]|nr:hypothetical protein J6590_029925 [Homalodisca vitripennis]
MNELLSGINFIFVCSEVRAKKPSLTLNPGTNGLKVTSEPPPTAEQAGCLHGQGRSTLLDLDNNVPRHTRIHSIALSTTFQSHQLLYPLIPQHQGPDLSPKANALIDASDVYK